MTREAKLTAIQAKVREESISLRSIQRGTALSINTVRAAMEGDETTTDSTINFLFLYLGLKLDSDKTEIVCNPTSVAHEVPA